MAHCEYELDEVSRENSEEESDIRDGNSWTEGSNDHRPSSSWEYRDPGNHRSSASNGNPSATSMEDSFGAGEESDSAMDDSPTSPDDSKAPTVASSVGAHSPIPASQKEQLLTSYYENFEGNRILYPAPVFDEQHDGELLKVVLKCPPISCQQSGAGCDLQGKDFEAVGNMQQEVKEMLAQSAMDFLRLQPSFNEIATRNPAGELPSGGHVQQLMNFYTKAFVPRFFEAALPQVVTEGRIVICCQMTVFNATCPDGMLMEAYGQAVSMVDAEEDAARNAIENMARYLGDATSSP